jgi:alkaline phosphatase
MKKKKAIIMILVILSILSLVGLIYNIRKENNEIKYVFLFIGDGMSLPQVDATEIYNNSIKGNSMNNQEQLSFTKFDTIGLRKNQSYDNYITDSSSSASALASGKLIENGKVNLDAEGNKTIPITYALKDKGMKIGIITNQSIDHATPAGFFAYCDDRNDYKTIAKQIQTSDFDFFAGSKIAGYSDDLKEVYKKAGYKYLSNNKEYKSIKKAGKYILVSPDNRIKYGMEQSKDDISISKYLEMSLPVLDNKKGFLVMVESGMIDTAAHNNDAKSVISEVNELDKAVKIAIDFAKKHPNNTLIIVTGDHETGNMSLGTFDLSYENLKDINMSISALEDYLKKSNKPTIEKLQFIVDNFNIDPKSETYTKLYNAMKNANGNYDVVINLIKVHEQNISGIKFSAAKHSGLSVPVYVYGDKNNIFTGEYTTDEFNHKLRDMLNIE